MRTTKMRSRLSLLFFALALIVTIPAQALADELRNSLDNTFDTDYEVMALQSGGSNGSATITLHPIPNDNDNNNSACNIDEGEKLTIKATSDNPSAATVEWAANSSDTIRFNGCGNNDARKLTVKPGSSAGTADVTFSIVENTTGNGTYTRSTARFQVNVAPPPNTPSEVSVTGVSDGASYEYGSVPAAGCSVNDAEDTGESATPTLSAISGPQASKGLGLQSATCSYTDGGGIKVERTATYSIVDTTKPVLSLPEDITEEAAGPNGAAVSYTASANDAVDGSITPSCEPASDSTFALGANTVSCSATDGSGNTATGTFTVTVADTKAPEITVPADIIAEATGASGAAVGYTASANDAVDGAVTPSCSPQSGTTFALGTTKVTCSASDAAGNSASKSFNVTVADTKAPEITVPADITKEATGASGAAVGFSNDVSATDIVDGAVTPSCSPQSGTTFALGTTKVTCSASDAAGNSASKSFNVTVQDTTPPSDITFSSGINDGGEFYYGDVPAQPTCSATDAVGLKGCVVTGYSTNVGSQTLTATATDNAGNSATKTLSYTVKAWTFNGFYQPVDMNNVINTVKGGSTVPIKFELFKGTTELTATSNVKQPLTAKSINCSSLASTGTDDIELTATGGTSLRYDTKGGQFIYNWQTPKGPVGSCYAVTISAQDGSSKTAQFKLK